MSGLIDLAGPWLIRPDARDEGLRERWWEESSGEWREIVVPCAWQSVLGQEFHGVAWYRRAVDVPREWSKEGTRVWLRFESVATDCRVWVNGVEVGRHVGDYLPFQFEVTGADGVNSDRKGGAPRPLALNIVIRVDEIPAPRPAPGILTENGHITKGFHDVLSLHHGGIWGGVALVRTGIAAIVPGSLSVISGGRAKQRSPITLSIAVDNAGPEPVEVHYEVRDSSGTVVGAEEPEMAPGLNEVRFSEELWQGAEHWSPESPSLYELRVRVLGSAPEHRVMDSASMRFGFRTVTTGGPNNSQILLNGKPILLRGILHWGHEPAHGAPAPTPDEVREELTRLKALGFNLVCLCMVYMPEYFYDIADEMGMLIWQEHPVWKSRMEDELVSEYRRLFEGFFRRDRRHPSVILVSGACEHECFNPGLAKWWWERARRELPGTLTQVQTAFLAWTNPTQTDLHDEHTYENSGRFAAYMDDVREETGRIGGKPFVMGETIIGTSWADAGGIRARTGPVTPWWTPKGIDECERFEIALADRHGAGALQRFKAQADQFNLAIRRFQSEIFRSHEGSAGWVMNHIRDVPQCRCGFKDDTERWRFAPEQTGSWLGDAAALLGTPNHRRGFAGGRMLAGRIGLSNFGSACYEGVPEVTIERDGDRVRVAAGPLAAGPGEVRFGEFSYALPRVEGPTRLRLTAAMGAIASNAWDLWVFPMMLDAPADVVRLDGLPFSEQDQRMDWDERAYSSGWGLKVQSWRPMLPELSRLLFRCPLWRFDAPMPVGTRVVVTHKLTDRLVEFMEAGGRVVLLASKTAGGLDARTVMLWGQCPLILEDGVLRAGESDWVIDLLHHDLTRRHARAVPVDDLGVADQVDPVVRLVFTHDTGVPKCFDAVFAAGVGRGLLVVSSLDHSEDAGRYLLHRLIDYALGDGVARSALDPALVRKWTVEAV